MPSVGRPGARPAGPAHLSRLARQPPRVGQRAPQQELDLRVGAAQLVGGPPGQGVVNGWVQPQQYALALAHRVPRPPLLVEPSPVKGTGVDDLLGGLLTPLIATTSG